MAIACEGMPVIVTLLLLHLVTLAGAWFSRGVNLLHWPLVVLALLLAAAVLFSLYFFRDPEREIPQGEGLVVSPADGRVLGIEEVREDSFMHGKTERVSIFMNIFDVHVNRFPVSGTVRFLEYRPGKFFNASLDKASRDNECLSLGLETGSPNKVFLRQIAGLVARRIVCCTAWGSPARRGERFGMIRFGSRLEVYLPPGARWRVRAGDKVRAGETAFRKHD